MSSDCLVIDDVDAALAAMTPLGRAVSAAAAESVRTVILDFAERRGWRTVRYETFMNWAQRIVVARTTLQWLVLDPLFVIHNGSRHVERFRIGRIAGTNSFACGADQVPSRTATTAILDDAAASGSTLRFVASRVRATGGRVAQVVLCASTREAKRNAGLAPHAGWTDFLPGDWQILHLRDGCAHLPFAGRRAPMQDEALGVDVRLPALSAGGSIWQSLGLIPSIRAAIVNARRFVLDRIEAELGRPAIVDDLRLLGDRVPCHIMVGQEVSAHTPLNSLLT